MAKGSHKWHSPEHVTQVHARLAARRAPPAHRASSAFWRAGDTALHHAVHLESQAIRQAVLDVLLSPLRFKKPNIAVANKDGLTPLMLAIRYGHGDTCDVLLRRQQNLNLADSEGCTALHHAGAVGALSRSWVVVAWGGCLVQQDVRSCLRQQRRPLPVHPAGPIPPSSAHDVQLVLHSSCLLTLACTPLCM
jgi:hypothetical protein